MFKFSDTYFWLNRSDPDPDPVYEILDPELLGLLNKNYLNNNFLVQKYIHIALFRTLFLSFYNFIFKRE